MIRTSTSEPFKKESVRRVLGAVTRIMKPTINRIRTKPQRGKMEKGKRVHKGGGLRRTIIGLITATSICQTLIIKNFEHRK